MMPCSISINALTIDFLNELRKPSKKLDDDGNEVVDTETTRFAMPPRVL
jgi:hypothetical protein